MWYAVLLFLANMAGFAEYQLFKLQIDELTLMEKGNLNLVVSFRNIKNYKALASQKKKKRKKRRRRRNYKDLDIRY